ncbi:EAL domain-containing protein [Caballeronia sp. LZ033]|uniref:sensor domain-containing protein n=1 Tax=Caballeronia sp. LZ033 TaxID=3038566 RepID=UPI00285EC883|nr:EAL domain-containing protein [Caballeronia sp. LZ033]MDR5817311.1 EAL domain-containing protein [Caballeronia sp. LZ033]
MNDEDFLTCGHADASSELVYRRLVQSITGYAIYMLDVDGIITTWNAGAQKAKGYAADEIIGRHYGCFYSVEERLDDLPGRNLETARTTGKYEAEGWRVRKDGSRFWAHVVIDALRDEHGVLFGFAKITRDCTEQRRVSEYAFDQERRFRFLVQSVTDYAIYMLDINGIVSNWNAGAQRTKGYSADEIVGRHFSCFYTPDDQAAGLPARSLATALAQGKYETESWRVRKDGTHFWAHVVIDPIYDDNGELFGFAKVTRDRTEARALQKQTRDHERSFRLLIEGVTDYAIYMLDANGIVSNWNAGAQRAKGYKASEIVGKHFSCFYDPRDQEQGLPQHGLDTARAHGKFEALGWRFRKDGTKFWAHVLIQPIYDDRGDLFGFAKITRDCTEQRETSLALEETTRNLDLALENMLQGLCLFNRRGRLVLCNDQFARILSIPADSLPAGISLRTVLRRICDRKTGARDDAVNAVDELRRKLLRGSAPGTEQTTIEFQHLGRSIGVVTRLLSHGGWVSTIEDVTERRAAERRISHLAHHDHLTDLPNRVSFKERLEHLVDAVTPEHPFALLYLDLDRFKVVNDTLGHHAGDELLKAVSQRLGSLLRASDQLARLSGDEFTILQTWARTPDDAAALAQRCIDALVTPFEIVGNEVTVGVSIGIVCCTVGSVDADNVLQQADLALYKAKREGRNCFRIYERGMNDPLRLRNELEDDLRRTLRADELEVHYQPIVDARSGRTTACEALLRWHHPKRGLISPAEFIPIAEERGLMPEIGAWVMQRACRDAAKWPAHVRLSINVSPAQLLYEDFTRVLLRSLNTAGLQAHRLEIEITETALLETSGTPHRILNEIRTLGVGVAMDDFGTGYSSLSILQSFPFTRVKIDRGFVNGLGRNPKSAAIVRAISELCRSLGLPITAEGVETAEQRQALLGEHCDELQGFLLSRALTTRAVESWLIKESLPQ